LQNFLNFRIMEEIEFCFFHGKFLLNLDVPYLLPCLLNKNCRGNGFECLVQHKGCEIMLK